MDTVPLTFLLDVDNTLLDNDQIESDLSEHLVVRYGVEARDCYWKYFEALRDELGYADYLGALQRYREVKSNDPALLEMSSFLVDYPFAERLYPEALAVLDHLRQFGPTVIVSDGDAVFQPRKVQRSGLWNAVEGRVLIYIHKEKMLDDVENRFPSERYVMVDDKLRILTAVKKTWEARVATVLPRQGHYGVDPSIHAQYPKADIEIDSIGELLRQDFSTETNSPHAAS